MEWGGVVTQVVRLEKTHPLEYYGEIARHCLSYSCSCAFSMAEIGFCSHSSALRLQKERREALSIRSFGCR